MSLPSWSNYRIVKELVRKTWGWGFDDGKQLLFVIQQKIHKKFLFWSWDKWKTIIDNDPHQGYFYSEEAAEEYLKKYKKSKLKAFQ